VERRTARRWIRRIVSEPGRPGTGRRGNRPLAAARRAAGAHGTPADRDRVPADPVEEIPA